MEICGAAIEAGATTLNLPDTVGYAVPSEYGRIFSMLREQLPEIDAGAVVLSCHCHNDLGLAVANTLAAIANGARQAEVTVNGIGERAGNAALEELTMALAVRPDSLGSVTTGIERKEIFKASRMVSTLTGLTVQRNKAVVGENAFAHESGIHQDGMLKNPETYEIMDPPLDRRAREQAGAGQAQRPRRAGRPAERAGRFRRRRPSPRLHHPDRFHSRLAPPCRRRSRPPPPSDRSARPAPQ